jgi:ketosteroid isomerase-like protein
VLRSTPQGVTRAFCEALNSGEVHRACACFTRDGCLITPDATTVEGREAIGAVLAQLVAVGAQISVEISAVLASGDVALGRERWTFRLGAATGGCSYARESRPTLVLRRVEGEWKLAIAAPWGWGG